MLNFEMGKIKRKKINAAHDASLVESHTHFNFMISLDSFLSQAHMLACMFLLVLR